MGWEDVTVPAGTFRALRIDSKGAWQNTCASNRLQYKFWYVPKVKWLVARSQTRLFARACTPGCEFGLWAETGQWERF
jgi:hypothetical protein